MSNGGSNKPTTQPIPRPSPSQPPQTPAPSAPPTPSMPGTGDPKGFVRGLVEIVKQNKNFDPSTLLSLAFPSQIEKLEAALFDELSNDELAKYGFDLRRAIRFELARKLGLTTPKTHAPFNLTSSGNEQVTTLDGSRRVKLRTDARSRGNVYTITYDGPTAGVHWIQFIWRQIKIVYPLVGSQPRVVSLQKRITRATTGAATRSLDRLRAEYRRQGIELQLPTSNKVYLYTTDENNPRWTVDGLDADTPFYDVVQRTPSSLLLADKPSANEFDVAPLFSSATPPSCISIFRAAAYLIQDSQVLYRATIELRWTIRKRAGSQQPTPDSPSWLAHGQPADRLEAGHRAAVARQFPKFDYLPGELIGPPVPNDQFERLSLSDLSGWRDTTVMERFEDAAKIAKANLIEDVVEDPNTSKLTINNGAKKEGLSYYGALAAPGKTVPGETGYIDASGNYQNPDMPHKRFGPLPKIAMLLGEDAFSWGTPPKSAAIRPNKRDKIYTIATMRHEMAHAIHNRTAVGWLLSWRDQLQKEDFDVWLSNQPMGKSNSVDYHLISSGLNKGTGPTEALAWTEGFVAAIPFLPPLPTAAMVVTKDHWPSAISQLEGAARFYNLLKQDQKKVREAVIARIRSEICDVLETSEKNNLKTWIDALLHPQMRLSPQSPAEIPGVAELTRVFMLYQTFLNDIVKILQSCP